MMNRLMLRLEDRNLPTLAKLLEVRLLGRHASTFCYNQPSHVYLELTPRCNLRCGWCVQGHEEFRFDRAKDMAFAMFRDIVPKLSGTRVLYLCLNGEPLLYEQIFEAIALARRYIPSVRFVTNGTLLTAEVGRELARAGLSQLGVSIDSPDRELMARIRGVELDEVAEKVRAFAAESKIPVEVRAAICAENLASLKDLPAFVQRFGTCRLLYFTLAEGFDEVTASSMTMLRDREAFAVMRREVVSRCRELQLRTNLEYLGFYPDRFFDRRRKGGCDALFGRHLAIDSKGQILPCCRYWGVALDSLADLSFAQAWNGRLTRAWRKRMLDRHYPAQCSNWCGFPPW